MSSYACGSVTPNEARREVSCVEDGDRVRAAAQRITEQSAERRTIYVEAMGFCGKRGDEVGRGLWVVARTEPGGSRQHGYAGAVRSRIQGTIEMRNGRRGHDPVGCVRRRQGNSVDQHALARAAGVRTIRAVHASVEIGKRVNENSLCVRLKMVISYIEAWHCGTDASDLVLIKRPLVFQIMASGVSSCPIAGGVFGSRRGFVVNALVVPNSIGPSDGRHRGIRSICGSDCVVARNEGRRVACRENAGVICEGLG